MRKRACADRALSLPNWGAYTRHLDPDVHSPGKRNTQKIERKHLTLRTRMKRLVRKTICFSNAYSARRLPLIPVETCHRFQAKVATDSGRNLPPIPGEGCH